jgi:hypothetical protein
VTWLVKLGIKSDKYGQVPFYSTRTCNVLDGIQNSSSSYIVHSVSIRYDNSH